MSLRKSRRAIARASAIGFTLVLTLAPLLAPPPGGSAMASQVEALPTGAQHLVSVGGSITEILYALGEEDRLVARDSTSLYPEAALALPDVGYMRALSPEGVLSVNPDGILVLEGSGPPEAIQVLQKASVPLVVIPERFDSQGIIDKIMAVGQAIGEPEKAEAFAAKVADDLDAARKITADVKDRKKVLFILSLQGGKILASGTGSAANGIIELAGGENAITGYSGYKQLTDEAVIEAQPDVVLMMDREGDLSIDEDELFSHPAIAATPAGKDRQVIRMDGLYLLGFGTRTAAAVKDLAVRLYDDEITN